MTTPTMAPDERTQRIAELTKQVDQAKRKADLLARICADRVLDGKDDAALTYAERFRSADQRELELSDRLRELLD